MQHERSSNPAADAAELPARRDVDKPPPEAERRDLPLPPLSSDLAFWGMTGTQFFGAFNDNVFKQIVLLLAVKSVLGDIQGPAMLLFAVPFILFSGIAGYYSERNSKKLIIVLAKAAEIVVMLLGLALLAIFPLIGVQLSSLVGLGGLFAVLFLMGAQSAFFGPGKFGILPEMLNARDLPKANGIVLMSTFLAIIFGTASAGPCNDFLVGPGRAWLAGVFCVLIATIGLSTSLLLRLTPPASPDLKFQWSTLAIPGDVWRQLLKDRPLLWALFVTCMFWLVGGIVLMAVNNLGKGGYLVAEDDPLVNTWTSLLAAAVGVGIALGCLSAGVISRGRADFQLMRIGCAGTVIWLVLLSLPGSGQANLLGYWGSLIAFVLLGVFTGLFIVPVQVFLQLRPPKGQIGRIIATMNLTNWIAILLSGALYWMLAPVCAAMRWPGGMFLFTALLMLPVALFYRPKNEDLD